jgi:glutamate carboxypeptidase
MTAESCLKYFTTRAPEMLELLEALVSMDSPSGDAEGISRLVGTIGSLLGEAGMPWREIDGPGGPHLFGEIVPRREAGPPVVLVGHCDTVWPVGEAARRPPRRVEGKLHGPGVFDMRAGLLLIVFALRHFRDSNRAVKRRVQVFLSADEELGSRTAHPHMERLLSPDSIALVLEPPLADGSLKTRRKGVGMYRLSVHGTEAHAGLEPEKGVSAIAELAHVIIETLGWADPARGITINFGQVRGGIATNVVPGYAESGLDVRFDAAADGQEIHERLLRLVPRDSRARIAVEGGIIFPPMVPTERTEALAALAIRLAGDLDLRIGTGKSGGGSDGSFLASLGLTVLDGVGVDGGGAHSVDEHVVIDRIPLRAALLTRLLLALNDGEC